MLWRMCADSCRGRIGTMFILFLPRRLDRSAKRGAERPSLHNKRPSVERRSLHSALRASVETTKRRGPKWVAETCANRRTNEASDFRLFGPHRLGLGQLLGDLHRVPRRALQELVAGHEQHQPVGVGKIAADAADMDVEIAAGL